MIFKEAIELIVLIGLDDDAIVYDPSEPGVGTDITAKNLERWRRWSKIFKEAESVPALEIAIQHAEMIYELTKNR